MNRVVRGFRVGLALGVLLTLVGCTGNDNDPLETVSAPAEPTYTMPSDVAPGTDSPSESPTYDINSSNLHIADSLPDYFQKVLDTMTFPPQDQEVLEQAIVAGRIDGAVYETAHAQYVQCMTGYGFEPQFRKIEGVYRELGYVTDDSDAYGDAYADCSRGGALIMALYETQQLNPDLLADRRPIAFQCLKKYGYVDEDYTLLDFGKSLETQAFPFSAYSTGPSDCLYMAGYAYHSLDED
jgi:hypothetical protein